MGTTPDDFMGLDDLVFSDVPVNDAQLVEDFTEDRGESPQKPALVLEKNDVLYVFLPGLLMIILIILGVLGGIVGANPVPMRDFDSESIDDLAVFELHE